MLQSFFSPRLLLPEWWTSLSEEEFVEQLKNRAFRDKVKDVVYSGKFKFDMIHPLTDPYWMDCFQVLRCQNKAYIGKTIGEIARQRRPDSIIDAVYEASVEAVFDILIEDPDTTWVMIIDKREYGALSAFVKHDAGMPCTDVMALPATPTQDTQKYFRPGRGLPPIAYGLFPHYLRLFVKEQGVMSLEEAIKKATSVPAQQVLGLKDRGVIKEGAYADLVVFNIDTLQEGNDFLAPTRPPQGIAHVLVNGTVVYEKMAHTGARPGKVLRHS